MNRSTTNPQAPAAVPVGGLNIVRSSVQNPYSSPPYTNKVSSKNRMTKKVMPFLPEEIIFQILLRLPAKVLHDVMRTVCRTWRKVIGDPVFVNAHLSRSPTTLLNLVCTHSLFYSDSYFIFYLIDVDQTTMKFNETGRMPYENEIKQIYMGHGDGLLLTRNRNDRWTLYLINPLTKQIVTLPRLPGKRLYSIGLYAVGCSPSTLKCKVVFNHYPSMTTYILTVGVDKGWRKLLVESTTTSMLLYQLTNAKGICGFIYWWDKEVANHLIALDVEKEVFYKVRFPEEFGVQRVYHTSSDRFLSFAVKQCSKLRWSELVGVVFWELADCKNEGEWRKLGRVDFQSKWKELNEIVQADSFQSWSITPVAVLNGRDVVIFQFESPDFVYIAYNFKTGRFFRCFDSPYDRDSCCIFPHVNSLVVI